MAPPPISINISAPKAANYMPVSPYAAHHTVPLSGNLLSNNALSNNLLCPRYAESDSSSAPPSPASIESFDVLDSVAWRRGYTTLTPTGNQAQTWNVIRKRWQRNRTHIIAILLLFILFVTGCTLGGVLAVRQERWRTRDICHERGGGDRCEDDTAWAKCVRLNGVGYCEGVMI